MTTPRTIRISHPNLVRGIHFFPNGQRHEEGLPAGTYTIGARVNLERKPAIELYRNGFRWYVSPDAIGE